MYDSFGKNYHFFFVHKTRPFYDRFAVWKTAYNKEILHKILNFHNFWNASGKFQTCFKQILRKSSIEWGTDFFYRISSQSISVVSFSSIFNTSFLISYNTKKNLLVHITQFSFTIQIYYLAFHQFNEIVVDQHVHILCVCFPLSPLKVEGWRLFIITKPIHLHNENLIFWSSLSYFV